MALLKEAHTITRDDFDSVPCLHPGLPSSILTKSVLLAGHQILANRAPQRAAANESATLPDEAASPGGPAAPRQRGKESWFLQPTQPNPTVIPTVMRECDLQQLLTIRWHGECAYRTAT